MLALALLVVPARAEDSGIEVLAGQRIMMPGDNLLDVARAEGLGYVELVAANPGIDPWLPGPGQPILLPNSHIAPEGEGEAELVVNLGDMRLYHRRANGGGAASYPIGIGREGAGLQAGTTTRVVGKRKNPTWVPPPSVRAEKPDLPRSVPPGPDNPLGAFSLDLSQGLVRIHGTNLPDGVGRRVSHGCIRLYPEDIAALFPQVAVGATVLVVDQPVKMAWLDGHLWLEVHPAHGEADAVEERRPLPPAFDRGLERRIAAMAGEQVERIDWSLVEWALDRRLGAPIRVTRAAAGEPMALVPKK